MTADAKVGLLLGLLFIVVIAFLINGPSGFLKGDKEVIETAVSAPNGRTIMIDQAVAEVARDLQAPPLRQSSPPQEVQVLDPATAGPQTDSVPAATAAQTLPPPVPEAIRQPSAPAVIATARNHIVEKGENLAVIAIKYYGKEEGNKRATIQKLFEKNIAVLESPDTVRVGDRLVIPSLEELSAPIPKREAKAEKGFLEKIKDVFEPASASGSTARYREYVVQPGDRLWDIAEQNLGDGKRYTELVKLNRQQIDDPDHVPAGIRLKIPVR